MSEHDTPSVRKAYHADYIRWLKKPFWDPTEAAILLAGFFPKNFEDGNSSWRELNSAADPISESIAEDIVAKKLTVRSTPKQWLAWAKAMKYELPAALISAAKSGQMDAEEPKILKRAALRDHFQSRWRDIDACLSEASRNDLGRAKVPSRHGYWYLDLVEQWGIENGKLSGNPGNTGNTSGASIWPGGGTRHRQK